MRIPRKLITLLVAALVLVGSAAYAEDAVVELVEKSDGSWQNAGLFWWRYNSEEGQLEWGPEACTEETSSVSVVSPASTEALPDGTAEHFGVNCRTVDIGSPTEVVADDELGAEDPSEPEDSMEEPTHGALVSAFAKDVKAADAAGVLEELAADGTEEVNRVNRGSFISRLAKLNPFKKDKDDTGSETEVDEADHDPEVDAGKAEKAPKVDNPNKANGKSDD